MQWPRIAARSPGWEHGIVYALAAVWSLGVLGPTLISLFLSVLGARGVHIRWSATLDAYRDILESGRWAVVLRTMGLAAFVSLICLACGFPFALWLAKRARPGKLIQIILMSLTIPFFLDPSARTIVWRTVLGTTGLVNTLLQRLHLIHAPIEWLLFSDFSVYLGLIGPYFPNMVMPIYLSILLIDDELLQASADLGASPWATLRRVVIPLAMPGIVAGIIFTFVPVMGDSVVPNILGGGNREYLADAVMSLSTSMNYSGAAALATIIVMMAAILVPLFWLARQRAAVRIAPRRES
jgi:ABC-type spermidine/putrescine transport system permease subunit I